MTPFAVSIERATVYRGGGRRWLTIAAAVRADCHRRLRERGSNGSRPRWKCECEAADTESGYSGYQCGVHERAIVVVTRHLRIYGRRIRREARRQLDLVSLSRGVAVFFPAVEAAHLLFCDGESWSGSFADLAQGIRTERERRQRLAVELQESLKRPRRQRGLRRSSSNPGHEPTKGSR